jgi:hypothetical protein
MPASAISFRVPAHASSFRRLRVDKRTAVRLGHPRRQQSGIGIEVGGLGRVLRGEVFGTVIGRTHRPWHIPRQIRQPAELAGTERNGALVGWRGVEHQRGTCLCGNDADRLAGEPGAPQPLDKLCPRLRQVPGRFGRCHVFVANPLLRSSIAPEMASARSTDRGNS